MHACARIRGCMYVCMEMDGWMDGWIDVHADASATMHNPRYYTGNESAMLGCFVNDTESKPRPMKKEVRKLNVFYSEESFRERLGCVRGTIKQLETVLLVTNKPMDLAEKPREFFNLISKSNRGDSIGAVVWEKWSEAWRLESNQKKAVLSGHRVDPGGAGPEGAGPAPKWGDNKEVVFYHTMPEEYYAMHLSDLPIIASVDLTPAAGNNALCHVRSKIQYVGVVHTQAHADGLYQHLAGKVLKAMRDEADTALYDAQFADMVSDSKKPKKKKDDNGGGRPRGRREVWPEGHA